MLCSNYYAQEFQNILLFVKNRKWSFVEFAALKGHIY